MNARSLVAGALCALGVAASADARPPQWTVRTLSPTFGSGGSTLARAINNRGDVAGTMGLMAPGFFQQHAFVWQSGTMVDLGAPAGANTFSFAYAINERGVVAGIDHLGHAYTWQDGTWNALGFKGTPGGINKFGAIVGTYVDWDLDITRAFYYRDGVLLTVPDLGGGTTRLASINDKGAAAGDSMLADGRSMHAIVYQDGVTRDVGSLNGTFASATAINNHGVVVGWATDPSTGASVPFIHDGAGMRVLLSVPGLQGGATAINDRGAVVGLMGSTSFLWDNGTVTFLDEIPEMAATGLTRLTAWGINDRGWITGYGTRSEGGATWQVGFVLIRRQLKGD